MARKTITSTEVKQRWESKAYAKYNVRLRHDTDQKLIDFVDANKDTLGTSAIFRDALEMYVDAQK